MYQKFTKTGSVAQRCSTMEVETISKNTASPKSQMSRKNFLNSNYAFYLLFCIFCLTLTSAFAQLTWSGDQTLTSGQVITQNITLTGTTTIYVNSGTATISGVISGNHWLKKAGSGKLILTGTNTFSNNLDVNGGTLQIGNGSSGSISNVIDVLIASNGTLRFEPGSLQTFSKVISGAGKVEYQGTSTKILALTANNTYTGTTTIAGGILRIGGGGTTGAVSGNIIVNNDGLLSFHRSNNYTYSGIISGSGGVISIGTGELTLNGANTYSGGTGIENGKLILGSSGTIANSSAVNFYSNTAKFSISGNKTIKGLNNSTYLSAEVILESSSMLTINHTGNLTYSGKISGNGGITKSGNADLTLNNTNTYQGATIISAGKLILGSSGRIENSSGVELTNSAAKFDVSSNTKSIKGLSSPSGTSSAEVILGPNILYINNTSNFSFYGKFTGTGGVTKSGSGTFTMFNTGNTATGTFTHNEGAVLLNACKWAGNYSGNTSNSMTLTVTGNATISGSLSYSKAINMSLSGSSPSKLTVTGNCNAAGSTFYITTSSAQTNYVLIQAGSGITQVLYTLAPVSGYPNAGLNVNSPTQLRFSTTTTVPPTITTTSLPGGLTGTAYNQTLTATGTSPITWSLASGSLPTGLTLSSSGAISGTPTTAGTSNFTVKATNNAGSDTKMLSIAISATTVPPTITTTSLPGGLTGTAYNQTLIATGTSPITWSLAGGSLPTGLTLSSSGVISGTPATAGTSNFTVKATNSAGSDTKMLSIYIENGVGVAEQNSSNITIYPNPTIGELRIESGELRIENVEVFDVFGRKQMPLLSSMSSEATIDISHLSAGVYFLKISTEIGQVTKKVLKE